ncbi:MAG: hypothetical protein EXS68_00825 [Candidatus Ryanbacteria bacterium]|nr:hypothetical protein [Candidatus Ryanbacteria bacterium]
MSKGSTRGFIQYVTVALVAAGFVLALLFSQYTKTETVWVGGEDMIINVLPLANGTASSTSPTALIPNPFAPPPPRKPVILLPVKPTPLPPAPKPVTPPPPPPPAVLPPPSQGAALFNCDAAKSTTSFYVDPTMQAIRVERELRAAGNTADADLLQEIACRAQGTWVIGDNLDTIRSRVSSTVSRASAAGKTPIIVLYNIPDHATLRYWSGVTAGEQYERWIAVVAESIGSHDALVVLEPDSIGLIGNLSSADQSVRLADLKKGVMILKERAPHARVYLDAGHSNWRKASDIANFLKAAGIDSADGFALNVSNYQYVSDEIDFGTAVSAQVGGKHFVIDTSRNGSGPHKTEWCNTPGVTIGKAPTTQTGSALTDAFLWIKPPGESDGPCNGGVPTGKFWLERALEMIRNSPYRFQ